MVTDKDCDVEPVAWVQESDVQLELTALRSTVEVPLVLSR